MPTSSISRDVSAQMLAQMLAHVLIALSVIMLVRYFSPHDNGVLNVGWGLTGFAVFLTDLGLTISLIRAGSSVTEDHRRHLVWTAFRARLTLTAAVMLIGLMTSMLLRLDMDVRSMVVTLVLPMTLVMMLLAWVDSVMVSSGRIALSAWFTFFWNIAHIAATALTPFLQGSLETYAFLHVTLTGAVSIVGVIWVWRMYPYSHHNDRGLLTGLAAFGLGDFLTNIVDYIPSVTLVPPVMSFASHGAFGAGEKIPKSLYFLPSGLGKAFFTRMCQTWPEHPTLEPDRVSAHDVLVLNAIRLGAVLGGVCGIGLLVTAPELIGFLWPNKWPPETALTLALVGFVPFVKTISMPLLNAFASSRQYALRARVLGMYAISAMLAFTSLPRAFGVTGAALAVILSELVLLVTALLMSRPELRIQALSLIVKFVLSAVCGALLAMLVKPHLKPQIHALFDACLPAAFGASIFLLGAWLLDQGLRLGWQPQAIKSNQS